MRAAAVGQEGIYSEVSGPKQATPEREMNLKPSRVNDGGGDG